MSGLSLCCLDLSTTSSIDFFLAAAEATVPGPSLFHFGLPSGEGPDWQRTARFKTPRLDPAYCERIGEPIEPNKTLAVQCRGVEAAQ
jgi:hypothetical protein